MVDPRLLELRDYRFFLNAVVIFMVVNNSRTAGDTHCLAVIFSFPVECLVQYANGTVIHKENLNSILFPDDHDAVQQHFENDGRLVQCAAFQRSVYTLY